MGLFAVEVGHEVFECAGDFFAVGSVKVNFQTIGSGNGDSAR